MNTNSLDKAGLLRGQAHAGLVSTVTVSRLLSHQACFCLEDRMNEEIWKDIPRFIGKYSASNLGNIKSVRTQKLRKCRINRSGYFVTNILYKTISVHKLVLEAFFGLCPKGMECRHLNGNSLDNRIENLCWGTHMENMRDSINHGTTPKGERNGSCKLSKCQVRMIRNQRFEGMSTRELSKAYNVSKAQIQRIINYERWKHI